MQPKPRPDVFWASVFLVLLALWIPGKVSVWMDDEGRPVLSNRSAPVDAELLQAAEIAASWRGKWEGEPLQTPRRDPLLSELAEALDDIQRGEHARALTALRRLADAHPERPEVFWTLGRVELARGRHPAALTALDHALAVATGMSDEWMTRVQALRNRVATELEHAESRREGTESPFVQESSNFRLVYDHPFAGRGYGDQVLQALERVRLELDRSVGQKLRDPLEVRLYTRADYLNDYSHRFGFGTVGFYDGAIHVVATRKPERRLVALLTHEYVHALFHRALGGHEPFFLNEGIAEREEARVEGRPTLARGQWRRLLEAQLDGSWLRLGELVKAFNRLPPERVALAYLEARAAAEVLEEQKPGALSRWLDRCAAGEAWEAALVHESGWGLGEFDRIVRDAVRARFPDAATDL